MEWGIYEMICEHKDCFTCPYDDCISNKDPKKKKPGRKKIPLEEKRKHRNAYNAKYRKEHRAELYGKYLERTEAIVTKRYKSKNTKLVLGISENSI